MRTEACSALKPNSPSLKQTIKGGGGGREEELYLELQTRSATFINPPHVNGDVMDHLDYFLVNHIKSATW